MTFDEYQETTNSTAMYPTAMVKIKDSATMHPVTLIEKGKQEGAYNEMPWTYPILLLASEVGEVASILQKAMRDNGGEIPENKMEDLSKEIGDILWSVAQLCEKLNLSMAGCARENIIKLRSRYERGVIGGSGDNR